MKSLINADDGSDLTSISPILTCIRTLNESGFILDEERSKAIRRQLKQLKGESEISRKDGFWFVVSLRDGACLYASGAVTSHLGYPEDMLLGQCFMNLLYHKDHLTFANHLTQGLNVCFTQGRRDDSHLVLNTFFCRIKVYQGLKFGYSITENKPQYKPFKIILHINELILDDICVETPSATLCVKATATQVLPAYTVPQEIPAMTSFSTRHTASCHFSHVDASAIPYLGFLPQDMIGYSVFDFYHIDDLPQLKEIYELVVKEHGTSFRSKPYRFKVHNGCYVMLETEWSCFINPWSHKLEFVVGQHRVLNGPSDINIFTPCEILETNASEAVIKESQAIQKEIKTILSKSLENVEFKKNKRFCNKRKRDLASFVYKCVEEKGEKPTVLDDAGSHSDNESVVAMGCSPYRENDDSTVSSLITTQQMRYQENIDRFFASQDKIHSDDSEDYSKNEKVSSVEDYQTSSTGSGNGSGSGNTSGDGSKDQQSASPTNYDGKLPESAGSSSKYMSSFTTGDSGYVKSWENNGTNDPGSSQADLSKPNRMKNSTENNDNDVKLSPCFSLTEETLCAHNKITHKQIKHQRKSKSTYDIMTTPHKDNSWLHQNEKGYSKQKKNARCHSMFTPVGITTDENNKTLPSQSKHQSSLPKTKQSSQDNSAKCTTNVPHTCSHPQNACSGTNSTPTPFFIPVAYMGSLPCFSPFPAIPQPINPFWPCAQAPSDEASPNLYPVNLACSFLPGVIAPSFPYRTFPAFHGAPNCDNGIPHGVRSSGVTTTSPLNVTTTTVACGTSTTFKNTIAGKENRMIIKETSNDEAKIKSIKKKQDCESNESEMQVDECSKSSSMELQDKDEDMDFDPKKFYARPNSDKVELSSDIVFRYQMDMSNVDDVLRKDREALKLMQQPDLVNKQLRMLQEEIKDENKNNPKVEDNFCLTEDIMLGLTRKEISDEELEFQEDSFLQLMCEDE